MERPNHLRSRLYFIGNIHNTAVQEIPILFKEKQLKNKKGKKKKNISFDQLGFEETRHVDEFHLKQIVKELLNKDFDGYSSLIFFIDIDPNWVRPQWWKDAMAAIYNGLKKNSSLRHVTKFIIFYARFQDCRTNAMRMGDLMQDWVRETPQGKQFNAYGFEDIPVLPIPNIDNLTIIEVCNKKKHKYGKKTLSLFMFPSAYDAVQEMANGFRNDSRCKLLNSVSTCAGGNYIFNINPALVFILNQITSPDEKLLDKREASLYDLIALQRTYLGKRTPTYIITDASQEDIYRLKLKLRFYNFSGIKYIFIIINAHGFDGDIIVTKNGSYNIRDDIWLPMTQNPTLKETQKFVIANACRLELTDDCRKLLENLEHKFNGNKTESNIVENYDNGVMIYSTTKGNESERYDGLGCIFLQEWSNQFAKNFDENLMETIFKDTAQEMSEGGSAQMPDLVVTDGEEHKIKMEPVNFVNFKPMLEGLLEGNLRREKDNDIIFMDAFVIRNENDELELMDSKLNELY